MNNSFFIVDNKLKLNVEYILFHKPFKILFDKNQGKDKDYIEGIFKYIYEIADPRSYSNKSAYDKDKSHIQALKLGNLPESFKVTKEVKDAIKYYIDEYYTVEATLLKELRGTLHLFIDTNRKIKNEIQRKINNDETSGDDLIAILGLQDKLFKAVNELPNKIESIKNLEAKVNEQLSKPSVIGRGGEEIPSSYEGDPDIEGEV